MKHHRTPPWPPRPPGHVSGYGTCVWCCEAITTKNAKRRQWHSGREGEPDCVGIYKIAAQSESQRAACWERDKGICAKCGCDASKPWGYRSGGPTYCYDRETRQSYPATQIIAMADWNADHIVPVWSVPEGLAWAEAFRFWSIDNLQTLCGRCHKAKSALEAAERARLKREAVPA